MPNLKKENKYANISIWSSIIGNSLLFVLKFYVGQKTSSVAVVADAWHTLSDSISSIIVLTALLVARKKPDAKHPYGYGRADTIASFILSVMLAYISFEFFLKAINKLSIKEIAHYDNLVIYVFIFSVVLKEIMAQVSFWGAKKTGIKSFSADGWHHRSDAIASFVILIGIFLNKYFWWIDGVLGIIVSIIIMFTAFEIMKEVFDVIIGRNAPVEVQKKIKELCNKEIGQNVFAHKLMLHDYGHHKEITFHIYLPPETTLKSAHEITDRLEQKIKDELNYNSTIHIEPLPDFLKNVR